MRNDNKKSKLVPKFNKFRHLPSKHSQNVWFRPQKGAYKEAGTTI